MLLELVYKIAGIQKSAGFGDFTDGFPGGAQQFFGHIDTVGHEIAVGRRSHHAAE